MRCDDALAGAKPLIGPRRAPLETGRYGANRGAVPEARERHPKHEMRRIRKVVVMAPNLSSRPLRPVYIVHSHPFALHGIQHCIRNAQHTIVANEHKRSTRSPEGR